MIRYKPVRVTAALTLTLASMAQAASGPSSVQLPTGGAYAAGAGSIQTSGNAITINQSTLRGIINWNSFSLSQGASVSFKNGSGATLNRVNGTTPSSILGQLLATGSIYLINPQGILIGHGAVIHTGGDFLATTLSLPDKSFLANKLQFSGDSTATVINLGDISSTGGSIYLVGRAVQNAGSLTAANGTAGLGAGGKVMIADSVDGQKVYIQAPGGDVTNSGFLQAAQVELKSNGGNIYALAGNSGGQINATGTATQDGHIWLVATNGTAHVSGTLSATNVDGTGGAIETSGEHVATSAAQITTGKGGNWLLDPNDLTIDSSLAGTIQTSLNGNTNVTEQTTASGTGGSGDITVASNIAWNTGASLTLSAYRNIGINNGVIISNTGAGNLTLRADNTSNGTGAVAINGLVDFSASTGNVAVLYDPLGSQTTKYTTPVTYNTGNAGTQIKTNSAWIAPANQTVSSQATAYMLVNNVTDLQNVSTNLSGTYGVGTDFSASSVANFVPLGISYPGFTGVFDGQGHTISGLTINDTTHYYVGLFGYSSGTLRNLNLAGESVTSSASGSQVGGLVGINTSLIANVTTAGTVSAAGSFTVGGLNAQSAGTVFNSSSTVTVSLVGGSGSDYAGGLVAYNSGNVSQSFATGSVTVSAPGSTTPVAGGLIGYSYGSIATSYATGNVSVAASSNANYFYLSPSAGGLVGASYGQITNSYASGGTVTGGANVYAGGLVGYSQASVTNSYATGLVSATTTGYGGGLFGHYASGTVASSYWDTQTSGQLSASGNTPPSSGVTGVTTSVLQNGALPTGFSSSTWVTLAGSYPLLFWQTKLVSGDVFNGSSPLSSVVVDALANGTNVGNGTTNSSGFYSFTVPAASFSGLLTYLPGTIKGNTFSDGDGAGQFTGMNIYANTLTLNNRTFNTYSGMLAALNLALGGNTGSNFLFSSNPPNITLASGANLSLNSQLALSLDQSINTSGAVAIQSTGNVTQTQPITATSLSLSGAGSFTLGQANSVGTLAANTGSSLSFSNTGDLMVGAAGGLTGVTTGGTLSVASTGNLTIASGAALSATGSGDALQLSAGNNFSNLDGASALSVTGGGRWLVFSTTPANDTRGGLPYDFKQYAYSSSGGSPAQSTGDGFIYTVAPTLTVGLVNVTKTYDGTTTAALQASNYTTGGALDGDTLTLTEPSSGTYSSASAGTGKPVTATGLSLVTATNGSAPVYGYQLSPSVTSNTGVINPATLTYTSNASSQTYGSSNPSYSGSVSGFVAGETLSTATSGSLLFTSPATPLSPAGSYAINGSGLTAGNYIFTQAASNATALTIVAGNVPTPVAPLPANAITISINNVIGQQGQVFPTFSSTYSGPAISGVNIASLLSGLSYQITPALNGPGTYQITASGTPPAGYSFNLVPGTLTLIDSTPTSLPSEAIVSVPEIPASLASEFKLDFLAPPNATGWFKVFVEDKLIDGSHQEKTPGLAGSYFFTNAGGQSVTYSSGVKP